MRTLTRLMALVVFASGAAACAAGGGSTPCTPSGATTTVQLVDFSFSPSCIRATEGGTLRLSNTGDAPHTFTVRGTEVSEQVDAGGDAAAPLAGVAPGTYDVVCTFHLQMVATLQVVAA